MTNILIWIVAIVVGLSILLPQIIRIAREYERLVVFRLGKLLRAKGPGLVFLIPFIDRIVRVDLRIFTINVDKQEVITKDNVTVNVDAITYFKVVEPEAAVVKVEQYLQATSMFAQTTLRSVLGQVELDELLSERDKINEKIQNILDEHTDPWGIKVTSVEIRNVVLPETMKRAMARQAESERDRRARIINAQGEYQAAEKLVEAAGMIREQPIALQLRYLQTVSDISEENTMFAFLPFPMEFLEAFKGKGGDE